MTADIKKRAKYPLQMQHAEIKGITRSVAVSCRYPREDETLKPE
tara:strand:- start:11010 stop:11141 length:132 start_codon:yes stop_codon:yes gene_type:complete